MTVESVDDTHTFTFTSDYLTVEEAQLHANARLSASPGTARSAAAHAIHQLWTEQNGVLTCNQVAAIATAAHQAATAGGASFDDVTQRYRACCETCALDVEQIGPSANKYGDVVKDGKLHNKNGTEICWTCHVPSYQHHWVSTPHPHPFSSAVED